MLINSWGNSYFKNMRSFKEILKDLEDAGLKKINERFKFSNKTTFGVRDGCWSHSKWSDLNTNKES
jgi:hypothetical protein